jgi:hypothetical protein
MSHKRTAVALLALTVTSASAGENPAPLPAELLEFIAEFQEDDGAWIDPFRLLETLRELTAEKKKAEVRPASLKPEETSNE